MIAAIGLAIFGGTLFQFGWAGIVGAFVIVGASILFAIGSVWTLRKTWADRTWPPDMSVDAAKAMRRLRVFSVVSCCSGVIIIGGAIALMVLDGSFWRYALTLFIGVLTLSNGILLLRGLTHPPKDDFWTSK